MERIGILGGTFDPPHIGHLILAEYSAEALGLSCLLFVPAADPPHKLEQDKTPIEHRVAMLEGAIRDNARFGLSRVDIERPGPHYTVETVQIIREAFPNPELYFVMGGDSLRDFPNWDHADELIRLCRLAVIRRPFASDLRPDMHEHVLPGLAERLEIIDAPLLEISSSQIIGRLRDGTSVRYLVPGSVLTYIEAHGLYR